MLRLLDLVFEHGELAALDPAERRLALRALLAARGDDLAALPALADAIDGYGPLTPFMRDDAVTDVLVNGARDVWVERDGVLHRTGVSFDDPEELAFLVERLLARAGARADASRPVADARLADGSRLHVVMPPVAPAGPLVSIRRFPIRRPDLDALAAGGMMSARQRDLLHAAVRERRTIAIGGGTGTGKTTLLDALLGCVGPAERVVTIEETPELRPRCAHVVSLVARPPNAEGAGEVDLASLVRCALRMRPDRIVVGEVRGAEAVVAAAAMSTGHEGSMVTVHARSADDVVERMVALALEAASGASEAALRSRFARAFDVVVHLERTPGGGRRVATILAS